MSNEINILIIVEGAKTEYKFFNSLSKKFGLKFEIYCLKTNIYTLYKKIKELDFNVDIKELLAEIHPEKKDLLSKKFAYTYLIFDCDAHHTKKDDNRSQKEIVQSNIDKLLEMVKYFVDETDPTIGKLYINYPMMESYRDCDKFFEDEYALASVKSEQMSEYKKQVANKKLNSKHVDKYEKAEFSLLILQNLYKLNFIQCNTWDKPNYENYLIYSNAEKILNKEQEIFLKEDILLVINTSLFLITDFFGNRNHFYDNLEVKKLIDNDFE